MASIISAGTSTGTALNLTGDTSGILQLASNNGTVGLTLNASQNVGVGTTSPLTKLDVVGPASVTSFTGTTRLGITVQGSTSTNDYTGIDFTQNTNEPRARIATTFTSSGSYLQFGTSNLYTSGVTNTAMTIDYLGKVLIGFTAAKPNGPILQSTTSMGAIGTGAGSYSTVSAADYNAYDSSPTYANCNMSKYGPSATGVLYSCSGTALAGWSEVVGINSNGLSIGTNSGPLLVGTAGSERMRIDSSGYIYMNTATSSYAGAQGRLQVNGGTTASMVLTTSGGASFANAYVHNTATSGNNEFIAFGTEATWTARGAINYNRAAGLVAYNTTSDYRAKNILGDIENALDTVNSLKVHNAIMKEATIERPMFVAHELQVEAPYAVTGEKDAEDKDGNPIYQQVDASSLVPLLTKAIQEQQALITQLQADVAALKGAK